MANAVKHNSLAASVHVIQHVAEDRPNWVVQRRAMLRNLPIYTPYNGAVKC